MTDTTDAVKAPQNVKPLVAATRRLTKAEKAYLSAKAAIEKVTDVSAVFDAAKHEYETAKAELSKLLAE